MKTYWESHVNRLIYHSAKHRAKKDGIPFNIELSDVNVPTHCPLLGLPLKRGKVSGRSNSPSLDRIVPELGYVKGNVMVISCRANQIKSNATLQELKDITENLDKILTEMLHERDRLIRAIKEAV